MEKPIDTVLVVRSCKYVGNNKFPSSSDNDRIVSEVGLHMAIRINLIICIGEHTYMLK